MQRFSLIALIAATFVSMPASIVLAQAPANTGTGTTTTAPAAAPPAATTPPAATADTKAEPAKPKKKAAKKMTRQQEIDRSIDRGTVPARYRSQIPKEYQHHIPFDKR